ncbi:glucosaminidase domain-containing protein [Parabacteroides acidifaciens]|uniref:Glucosaminidase n=1 Tax=Parabacteroides acidifaciens TaxID=2290935 RepID=A0A3D8HJM0_9BACT|nr:MULTISPECIES: glucosaminidase domain-containing protein [Parabacteroides]MBC8600474.1 glucosaminidase domain-containing protein [Parabacteroides acidifaciens]RDU50777.1 glucosaminidase [Parabacteroides acidifaciens]RHO69327.1 glucosaminidase [Parabacteroides sp. AF48-14]
MKPAQISFVKECLPAALSAGAAFNMNPLVILAQAALESGWGMSDLARESRNFFGLTAYGCSNAYWHGGKTVLKTSAYSLDFRRYDTRENSFLDFARLIRDCYRRAWQVSNDPEAYAKEIAYSPYISEQNGDNRETYRHSIIQIARTIQAVIALIEE